MSEYSEHSHADGCIYSLNLSKSRIFLVPCVFGSGVFWFQGFLTHFMPRLDIFRHPSSGVKDERIVDEVMQLFDVTEFKDRYYQTLSGGERQRVNFARVLAQLWRDGSVDSCRYLFLDEPLTFLDIRHQMDFMKRIRSFTDAAAVVTVGVVHDLNLAARLPIRS